MTLPKIPERVTLRMTVPQFIRSQGDMWFVIGPEGTLPVGEIVEVPKWRDDPARVFVVEHVAERTVTHRPGSYNGTSRGPHTRYVVARFRRLTAEESASWS